MIAIDSSVVIPWLNAAAYPEADRLHGLIETSKAVLTPVTVTEVLSDPRGIGQLAERLAAIPVLPIADGFWLRAGLLRAEVGRRGRKAGMADALIAQACIDADVPLLTRDADFVAFVEVGGLKLA